VSINLGRRLRERLGPGRKPKESLSLGVNLRAVLNLGRNQQEMLSLGVRARGVRKNPGLIPRFRSGWFEGMASAVEPEAGKNRAAINDEVKVMVRLI
jgi:hypothetical protein